MSAVVHTLNIAAAHVVIGHGHLLAGNIPPPVGVQPPGTQGLTTILSWIAWAVTFLCVVGVFFVAGSMAIAHRRGEGSEAIGKLGWVMGACILGASATSLVNVLI